MDCVKKTVLYIFILLYTLQNKMSISANFHSANVYNSKDSSLHYSRFSDGECKTDKVFLPNLNIPLQRQQRSKNVIESEYYKFFQAFETLSEKSKVESIPHQILRKHRIKIISEQRDNRFKNIVNQGYSYVELASSKNDGLLCEFQVVIANFLITVVVVNLHRNSQQTMSNSQFIGEGSFGTVRRLRLKDKQIALKKIKFPPKKQTQLALSNIVPVDDFADCYEIRRAISQYCIYKICSMFQIGPQIIFENEYDLVCYNDCVEFQMQLCEPVCQLNNFSAYQRDIKKSLSILHFLKIIHKDIKKQNTLYSPTFKSYVLSDFGLSHCVKQNIWQESETFFGGSITHACPQMKQLLYNNQIGFVNLYLNDIHCLQVTLDELKQKFPSQSQHYSKNQMSMGQNYYDYNENDVLDYCDEQNETNQYISEDQINLTNLTQSSFNQSRIMPTQATCNTESLFSTDKINYYEVQTLYRYFKKKTKYMLKEQKLQIQPILNQIIKDEPDSEILSTQILKYINPIINSQNNPLLKFTTIRNAIRMFGLNSQQTYKKLKQFTQTKKLPYINYDRLQNYLQVASKVGYNNYLLKRFKNHIVNMDRHMCFRNKRSLVIALKTLIKSYFSKQDPNEEQRNEILVVALEVLNFEGLSEEQNVQIVAMLWMVFEKRAIKFKEIDGKCVLELADKIYQEIYVNNSVFLQATHNLMKLHIVYNSLQKAAHYYNKLTQRRILHENQYSAMCQQKLQIKNQLKIIIIRFILAQISYFISSYEFQKALQIGKICYKKYTEFQITDQSIKITILNNIISTLIKLKICEQAEILNEQMFQLIEKYCFPKQNCVVELAFYYSFKGMINMSKDLYYQALGNFDLVLENTDDTLKGSNSTGLIKQTLINISVCYSKINEAEKSIGFLQKALQFSLTYQYQQYQQSIQIIHHIIIALIKMNKFDAHFAAYLDKLATLKNQLLKSNRVSLAMFLVAQQKLPFFQFQACAKQNIQKQSIILARKIMIQSVEPYLPRFQSWYVANCQQLAQYYNIQKKSINKALPYYWKIFKCLPKSQRTQRVYLRMDYYVELLIKANSSRRALKFLKQYAPYIPQNFQNIRMQAYKKINKLSQQLNVNDKQRQYYNIIWRNKAMKTKDSYEQTENKINSMDMKNQIKMIWEKKLKCLKPSLGENNEESSSFSTQLSQQNQSQDSSSNNEKDTQNIIKQKLKAKRSSLRA